MRRIAALLLTTLACQPAPRPARPLETVPLPAPTAAVRDPEPVPLAEETGEALPTPLEGVTPTDVVVPVAPALTVGEENVLEVSGKQLLARVVEAGWAKRSSKVRVERKDSYEVLVVALANAKLKGQLRLVRPAREAQAGPAPATPTPVGAAATNAAPAMPHAQGDEPANSLVERDGEAGGEVAYLDPSRRVLVQIELGRPGSSADATTLFQRVFAPRD